MKRYASIILALTLIIASVPVAFAAGVEQGETASVNFTFDRIYGIDGEFTYSNASILDDVSYSNSGNMDGKIKNNIAFFYDHEATDFTITVTVKVADTAKNGDCCDITFKYRTSDRNGNMTEWQTMTRTVTVEVFDSSGEWYRNTLPLLKKPKIARLPMPSTTMETWYWRMAGITHRMTQFTCVALTQ